MKNKRGMKSGRRRKMRVEKVKERRDGTRVRHVRQFVVDRMMEGRKERGKKMEKVEKY